MNGQPREILIPSEYSRLLDRDWREAAIHGGRNSLKSHTVARVLLIRAMSGPGRAGCFREFQNSIADSSLSLLANLIEEHRLSFFKITKDSVVNTRTGYDFIFRGLHNNIQSVKSIEGITEAWIEEAQTITEQSLEVLSPTVRLPGSQLFYTYNRLRDKDPVHQRLVVEGRPNTIVLNLNYDVALKYGWMSDALKNEMESDRDNRPEVYKHKWLGEPSNKKGRIYPNWKKIAKIPNDAKFIGYGVDWGYTNDPTAIVAIYKWNNAFILDEVAYEREMKNFTIANRIRKHNGLEPATKTSEGKTTYKGQTSPVAVGDSSEPKSIADVADAGVNIIGAVKGKDSVNNGIDKLQQLEIYFTESSHNIEEEQLNYVWLVNKEDKTLNVPIDAYNHIMDAARYKITHYLTCKPVEYAAPIF